MVEEARKANKLWMQRENSKAHLLGMYIYEALCDVSPVLQAFAKKGDKANSVSDKAIRHRK